MLPDLVPIGGVRFAARRRGLGRWAAIFALPYVAMAASGRSAAAFPPLDAALLRLASCTVLRTLARRLDLATR